MFQKIKKKSNKIKDGFLVFILRLLIIAFYFFVSIVTTALMWYGLNLILDFYKLELILYSWPVMFTLIGWLIFWFYVFFVNIRKKGFIGTIFVLEKPTNREKESGPYLKFPWIEESVEFSMEPHIEHVTFDKNDDIFVTGNNYIVGDIEVIWRVKSPMRYYLYKAALEPKKIEVPAGERSSTLISDFTVAAVRLYAVEPLKEPVSSNDVIEDNGKFYPNIDYILRNGRKDLPDRIIRELTMKKDIDDKIIEEKETIEDWGIDLTTRPRVRDLDPLPEVKESQKKAAKAIYDKIETITIGEADLAKRELGAKAKKVEGFAEAAIEGKKIERQFSAFLEAAGIEKADKEAAINFILARIGLDAIKSGDKIILGTNGIMDLAKEFAVALKEGKK